MSSADFRKSYASISEPVEVTAYGKRLGTWTPTEWSVEFTLASAPAPEQPPVEAPAPAKPHRMTIKPVKESKRPALEPREIRVVDTTEARRAERARWSAISSRLSGERGRR